jgi:hypothetical protein
MAIKPILPGYVLSIAIAQALAERDPGYLPMLREKIWDLQQKQPRDSDAYRTLTAFLGALDDRQLFPPAG